ncbi:EamA family transporter [Arthrobacter monumenti]
MRNIPARLTGSGLGVALVSAATFGVSGPFAKSLLESGWSPGAAVGIRLGGAALVLVVPILLTLRGRWSVLLRGWPMIVAYGLVPIAACQLFYFNAVQHLSVGVALLLEYLAPVLIVGWLWLRTQRAPRSLTAVGAVIAMAGLALVLDLFGGSVTLSPIGVMWGLLAAVCLAAFFLMSAHSDDALPPMVLVGGGLVVGTAAIFLAGWIGLFPMKFAATRVVLVGAEVSWLVPALGLVLICAVASYLTGLVAVRRLGSQVASFIALTEVLFAVLAAWLMLGELPGLIQLAGGSLIVTGVVLVRYDELRRLRKFTTGASKEPLRETASASTR